jgi:streptogramin lyase
MVAVGQGDFVDHGVGAPAAESRGVVCLQDADGRAIALCCAWDQSSRGWLLAIDVHRGQTQQVLYPEGVPNSPVFASLLGRSGRFYTFAGKVLLELDPVTREWLYSGTPAASEECYCGTAMCDGPDGRIYAGSYPNCRLVSYDPATRETRDIAQLDRAEHYVMSLVADSAGWLYAGIGTARANLAACNPTTGEVRQLVEEADRQLGSGSVYLGQDGTVYGRCGERWFRLSEGRAEAIAAEARAAAQATGALNWGQTTGVFPDGRRLRAFDLPERYLEVEDPRTGEVRRVTFDYPSEGAMVTSLAVGPDGQVYGSSAHPMHLFVCDPATGRLTDWGGIPRVDGGNFCAMAAQGGYLFGAAYSGGYLYRYDPAQPWNGETGDDPNPRLMAQFGADINRPRWCLAHPDGRHVVMAGFMDYGMRGGGLAIHDVTTEETQLLKHTDVVPEQSTIALVALPSGDLVGGTSIETPGGGHATETEGVLYVMDWATRKVIFRTVPVPGAAEVYSLALDPDGLVYGIASNRELFVFDPGKREVLHRASLAEYGSLPRQVFVRGEDGRILALLSGAILRIEPKTFAVQRLAEPPVPITAGVALAGGRLYFASGSHLWSYRLA